MFDSALKIFTAFREISLPAKENDQYQWYFTNMKDLRCASYFQRETPGRSYTS